mmetsp:Transcript_90251/g.263995  ORF Transcript_90251/g.263995 Transcript_90251/m.263995 type:complete len:390 (+) Transcript_90251:93-1262(+)
MPKRRRTSTDAAAGRRSRMGKKARRELDPIDKKCALVATALRKHRAVPEVVGAMFGDVIPFSLALFKEERHAYQQGMVEAVEREMLKLDEALESALVQAKHNLEKTKAGKEVNAAKRAAMEAKLALQSRETYDKKMALAQAAMVFRRAKEGLAEAEAKQKACNKELEEVAFKHEALSQAISEVLEPLKEGTMDKDKVPAASATLIPTLQCYFEIEESLVPAIPTVLSKEPSTRGPFDTMAAVQLEEQAKKAVADFAAAIKGGEAMKEQRAAAVAEAAEVLKAARDAQRVSAGAFTAAKDEERAMEAAVLSAKMPLKGFSFEKLGKTKLLWRAEETLKNFREGPLVAFKELSSRSKPPAEEAPAEAVPVEPAAEPAEVEVLAEPAAAAVA